MTLNQSQGGILQTKQGQGNRTWNRKQSSVSLSHEENGGRCEDLSGYTFDCGSTKYVDTYLQSMEESVSYFSVNFKEGFYVSQAVQSETTYLLKKTVNPKATQKEVEENERTVTIKEVDPDETDLGIWKNEVKGCVSSRKIWIKT